MHPQRRFAKEISWPVVLQLQHPKLIPLHQRKGKGWLQKEMADVQLQATTCSRIAILQRFWCDAAPLREESRTLEPGQGHDQRRPSANQKAHCREMTEYEDIQFKQGKSQLHNRNQDVQRGGHRALSCHRAPSRHQATSVSAWLQTHAASHVWVRWPKLTSKEPSK